MMSIGYSHVMSIGYSHVMSIEIVNAFLSNYYFKLYLRNMGQFPRKLPHG